ncbi:hypothetical protein TIFTF001_014991 [Ficus carica]|uniref:Uncharacterized protein n=1 Tax=Ficus carica TaxID=3494 RepID=A0AA88A6E6_FICCA|nr:hypothetical protein TIFTF001_014991 [Ficus carica]
MQKLRKRKQPELQPQPQHSFSGKKSAAKRALPISGLSEVAKDPYTTHPWPTSDQCRAVRDDLLALHGFPKEFAKYRRQKPTGDRFSGDDLAPKPEPLDGEEEAKESVLDGLVMTVLSQNTTEANSQRAFASLKSAFPTWEDVNFDAA